ncbi:MAG: hypothetical protein ABSF46_13515 [Terriglobia bacterium]|jgi:hypothetical protein
MTPSVPEIIRQIEQAGGRLDLDRDRVRYRLPACFPEPEAALAALRTNRAEVVRVLRARQNQALAPCGSPQCAGCYELEPGRRIHPPRSSPHWLAWLERWQPKGPVQ